MKIFYVYWNRKRMSKVTTASLAYKVASILISRGYTNVTVGQ